MATEDVHPKLVMERVARRIGSLQERALHEADLDLTTQQATVLIVVATLGPQRVQQLATALGVDQSAATRLVDRLEMSNAVVRSRSPDDGRVALVSLTASGRTTARSTQIVIEDLKHVLLAGITDHDLEAFWRVLGVIELATRNTGARSASTTATTS